MLFALADRDQIAALTRYAAEDDFSISADEVKASGIPLIRGSAEEVLKLKPDLVLAGTFTRRATREQLKAFGIRLETFAPAETMAAAKADMRRTRHDRPGPAWRSAGCGDRRGHRRGARGRRRPPSARSCNCAAMATSPAPDTLFDDALAALGLANAGREFGLKGIRQASLEAVLKVRADALVLFDACSRPGDQGAALLYHPALRDLYPAARRILMPGSQLVCGGPSLPLLLRSLARGVAQLHVDATQ